ncbi:hypothetical protein R3P38DRAFT_2772306 [Favolaschia claudopus]|uniref:Uncharacterized protein n=1 Tax=Favolaschia claudopus TaxID=2862362 RepID=A0AAW0C6K9_9AGAR
MKNRFQAVFARYSGILSYWVGRGGSGLGRAGRLSGAVGRILANDSVEQANPQTQVTLRWRRSAPKLLGWPFMAAHLRLFSGTASSVCLRASHWGSLLPLLSERTPNGDGAVLERMMGDVNQKPP